MAQQFWKGINQMFKLWAWDILEQIKPSLYVLLIILDVFCNASQVGGQVRNTRPSLSTRHPNVGWTGPSLE